MAFVVNDINAMVLMIILSTVIIEVSNGEVYKVGDSAGWTTVGNVDYKLWSATKTFHLGDVIRFEYNPQFHNVMRVTHAMYKSCNASLPLESYTTGNDSITITTRGHHLFLCGVPGHCQAGQKVDINVPRTMVANIAPSPSVFVSPSVPIATETLSPSANKAVPASLKSHVLVLLGLVYVVFGFNYV